MRSLLVLAALLAAGAQPAAAEQLRGPAAALAPVCDAVWHDATRNRDVPVRIRMPAGGGSAPVILFSHGLGGSLDAGTDWAQAWARAGFIVVHMQHAGSDSGVLRGGMQGLRAAMNAQQLTARAADVHFALDRIATHPHEGACDLGRVDMAHVGMSGHSFGAHTTLAVIGQNYAGAVAPFLDRRIVAAIAFSPAPPRSTDATRDAAAFGGIRIPTLTVTGTRDGDVVGNGLTPPDRQRPFRAMAPGDKYLIVFDGADHMNFGGNLRRAPSENDRRVTRLTAAATTAFWQATLLGQPGARAALSTGGAIGRSLGTADRMERR